MKVKSILSRMDCDDIVEIFDGNLPIGNMRLYKGYIYNIRKHNPINDRNVKGIIVFKNIMRIDVGD